jgi:ribokinase
VDHLRQVADAPSGVALILLEQAGRNRIVVMSGANARVGDAEIETATRLLSDTDVVLMQFEIPLPVVAAVAREARARGVRSVLDAGAATSAAIDAGIPALVDVLSPNETEAEALTGISVRDLETARGAAQRLRELEARDVVLKLGSQGAYWLGADGEQHFPAFPVDPVDTTAAGDAFTGSLAVSLAASESIPDAIPRANAAGALACLTLGAQPSMPTADAVAQFLEARAPST